MENHDLISVIIPIYKVEAFLDRCVLSVVEQSYSLLEIILVDDGSPDNCPQMCDEWAQKDSRIKVIHKENGGLSDARNAGMKSASGEYIAFVDSDDWVAPEFVERLLSAMRDDDSQIAACTVEMVWEDGTPSSLLTARTNALLNQEEAQRALLEESLLKHPVWYKLYKRETIAGIAFEVGRLHEDVFWSYQAVGRAEKVSVIDYIGYYYFQRSGSIMGKGYSLKTLDALEARVLQYQYIVEHFPGLELSARINLINNCIYHGQMTIKYLDGETQKKALEYIMSVKKEYSLEHQEYTGMKLTHLLWMKLANISFLSCCRLKNFLGIGM